MSKKKDDDEGEPVDHQTNLKKLINKYYNELFDGRIPLSTFNKIIEETRKQHRLTEAEMTDLINQVKSVPSYPHYAHEKYTRWKN